MSLVLKHAEEQRKAKAWINWLNWYWNAKVEEARYPETPIAVVDYIIKQLRMVWTAKGWMVANYYISPAFQEAYDYNQRTVRCITWTKLHQIKKYKQNRVIREELKTRCPIADLTGIIMAYYHG
jgi:hypothetical protein